MSSLASVAHHATAAPFNADYYVATATVIPVLFLALAVQGRFYENLLASVRKDRAAFEHTVFDRWAADGAPSYSPLMRAFITFGVRIVVAQFLAFAILLYGGLGEIEALGSLYLRHVWGHSTNPLIASALLSGALAIGPLGDLIQTFIYILPRQGLWPGSRRRDTTGATARAAGRSPALRRTNLTRPVRKPGARASTGSGRKGR